MDMRCRTSRSEWVGRSQQEGWGRGCESQLTDVDCGLPGDDLRCQRRQLLDFEVRQVLRSTQCLLSVVYTTTQVRRARPITATALAMHAAMPCAFQADGRITGPGSWLPPPAPAP